MNTLVKRAICRRFIPADAQTAPDKVETTTLPLSTLKRRSHNVARPARNTDVSRLWHSTPADALKLKMIERAIYNICVTDEMTANAINIPAFERARNGVEIIKRTGMVDFYFNNRKKIVQFCRRNKI